MRINKMILVAIGLWLISIAWPDSWYVVKKPLLRSVFFLDDSTGWVAGYLGIFETRDGGRTWRRLAGTVGSLDRFTTTSAVRGTGMIVWADKRNLIVRADDGLVEVDPLSNRWTRIVVPMHLLDRLDVIVFGDRSRAWGGASGDGFSYITSDRGATWRVARFPLSRPRLHGVFAKSATEFWAVGSAGVVMSTTDGGSTWKKQPFDDATEDIYSIEFLGSQKAWMCGTEGTVWHTADGGHRWTRQNRIDSGNSILSAISFTDENDGWAVGSIDAEEGSHYKFNPLILHTCDGGRHWRAQVLEAEDALLAIRGMDGGAAWAVGDAGMVVRLVEHGKRWYRVRL